MTCGVPLLHLPLNTPARPARLLFSVNTSLLHHYYFFFICLLSVFWTTRDLLFLQTCFIQHLSCLRPPSPLTTLNVIHSLLQGYIHSFYYCSYKGCLTGQGEPIIINTYSSYRSQGCGSGSGSGRIRNYLPDPNPEL